MDEHDNRSCKKDLLEIIFFCA